MNEIPKRVHQYKIIFLIFSVPFLMGLGVDLYVPSLPAIANYFNTQAGEVQRTITLYMLGYGIGQFLLGIVSDASGRKVVLRSCAIVFTIASYLCISASDNIGFLQLFRFIQGLSVAGLAVVARAMIVDIFDGENLYKYTNYFGLSWSLGPIIGPIIGGYLSTLYGWKSNFIFFTLYGMVICAVSFSKFNETNKNLIAYKAAFNVKNILKIVTHPAFIGYTIIGGIGYSIIVYFNVIGPFLLQNTFHLSPVQYGYCALILGMGYFFGSMVNKVSVNKWGSVTNLKTGLLFNLILSVGMILWAFLMKIPLILLITETFFLFFFIGFIVPNTLVNSLKVFPKSAGTSSSLFGTLTGVIVSLISWYASIDKEVSTLSASCNYVLFILISIAIMYFIQLKEKQVCHKS